MSKLFVCLFVYCRLIESVGIASFFTGALTLVVDNFTADAGKMFAVAQVIYAIGGSIGPLVGGGLDVLGGFVLPFEVIGLALIFLSFILFIMFELLPWNGDFDYEDIEADSISRSSLRSSIMSSDSRTTPSMRPALKTPTILLACFGTIGAATATGAGQTTLAPHFQQLGLSTIQTSILFFILGAGSFAAPIFGALCDKYWPVYTGLFGSSVLTITLSLVGPLPFIPVKMSYTAMVINFIITGKFSLFTFFMTKNPILRNRAKR